MFHFSLQYHFLTCELILLYHKKFYFKNTALFGMSGAFWRTRPSERWALNFDYYNWIKTTINVMFTVRLDLERFCTIRLIARLHGSQINMAIGGVRVSLSRLSIRLRRKISNHSANVFCLPITLF